MSPALNQPPPSFQANLTPLTLKSPRPQSAEGGRFYDAA